MEDRQTGAKPGKTAVPWFGTRRSKVRILPPRPFLSITYRPRTQKQPTHLPTHIELLGESKVCKGVLQAFFRRMRSAIYARLGAPPGSTPRMHTRIDRDDKTRRQRTAPGRAGRAIRSAGRRHHFAGRDLVTASVGVIVALSSAIRFLFDWRAVAAFELRKQVAAPTCVDHA